MGEWHGHTGSLESPFGETAGPSFQKAVQEQWQEVTRMALPSWPFVRDHLAIFRRRHRAPCLLPADTADTTTQLRHTPKVTEAPHAVDGDGGGGARGFAGGGGRGVSCDAHQVHGERAREAERKPREGHASDLLHEAERKLPGPCATQAFATQMSATFATQMSAMSQGCWRSTSRKSKKRCGDEVDEAHGWVLRDVVVRLHRRSGPNSFA